ncbi:Uracil phosphoribosyltransferase [Candidatus Hepatincolaceae symbiont of Richtersius coronifer]
MTNLSNYKNFFCLDYHPLVTHKLTCLRDKTTPSKEFREIIEEITLIVASEALRNLKFRPKFVETPVAKYEGIKVNKVTLLPIIRAGLSMMSPLQKLLPDAKVGFIGIARDHTTLQPKEYYLNIPKIEINETVLILDPMLATGNTVAHTIKHLINNNNNKNIIIISILSTPIALKTIFDIYPDCLVYSAGCDECLNDQGYITPGLGDAGDRIFNT